MNRERSNLQSTTIPSMKKLDDLELKRAKEDIFPTSDTSNIKKHEVTYNVLKTSSQAGKAFMDLTGKYPIKSQRGNQYIFVGYNYDANAILETIENAKT